jgi:hypothetical protein
MIAGDPTPLRDDFLQSSEKVIDRTKTIQDIIFRRAHASAENTIPSNTRTECVTLRAPLSPLE